MQPDVLAFVRFNQGIVRALQSLRAASHDVSFPVYISAKQQHFSSHEIEEVDKTPLCSLARWKCQQ
jgi:hypothetical protein